MWNNSMVCFTLVLLQHLVISVLVCLGSRMLLVTYFYFDVHLFMPILGFFMDCILI